MRSDKSIVLEDAILKEINRAYAIPLPSWLAKFIPDIHLSPLGLLEKKGKARLIIDHSFQPSIASQAVNMMHWVTEELPLEYGSVFMQHLVRIYNLRISYPSSTIFLFDDDISSAFRHVKYNPFVAGAFSFIANDTLLIPTAQTFGSNTSPANYEPLARARAWLSTTFSSPAYSHLISKHKDILDTMVIDSSRHTLPSRITTVCVADIMNQGVLVDGEPVNTPHYSYVDDTPMADILPRITQAAAASLESCFEIYGVRADHLRPCPISLPKYLEHLCSPIRRQLGITINTNTMCLTLPSEKLSYLVDLLRSFHPDRREVPILECAKLLGYLAHISTIFSWFTNLYLNIRDSFNSTIRHLYLTSADSALLQEAIRHGESLTGFDRDNHLRYVAKVRAKAIYSKHLRRTIFLSPDFHRDLDLLTTLSTDHRFWIQPIPHIIPRTHTFTAYCDSCMYGAGGHCPQLGFFWHMSWPSSNAYALSDVLEDDNNTHINLYEYIAILITYSIAASRFKSVSISETYPTINILSDNTAACAWASKGMSSSDTRAKHIARITCSLQLHSKLGLVVNHIEGEANCIADAISRLILTPSRPLSLQVLELQQLYPSLRDCTLCQVPCKLNSLLTQVLSAKSGTLAIRWQRTNGQLSPVVGSSSNGLLLWD